MPLLGATVRIGVKAGILGGALYYTTKAGLWGDSSQTEQLYKDLYKTAAPYLKHTVVEMPELPRASDATRAMTRAWNCGVISTTDFLAHLPSHVSDWAATGYDKLNELVSDPSPPSQSK